MSSRTRPIAQPATLEDNFVDVSLSARMVEHPGQGGFVGNVTNFEVGSAASKIDRLTHFEFWEFMNPGFLPLLSWLRKLRFELPPSARKRPSGAKNK